MTTWRIARAVDLLVTVAFAVAIKHFPVSCTPFLGAAIRYIIRRYDAIYTMFSHTLDNFFCLSCSSESSHTEQFTQYPTLLTNVVSIAGFILPPTQFPAFSTLELWPLLHHPNDQPAGNSDIRSHFCCAEMLHWLHFLVACVVHL